MYTEFFNRRLFYGIYLLLVCLGSFFSHYTLVLSLAFLVMIRLCQLLNQKEYANGVFGFYLLLPFPRAKFVLAKFFCVMSVMGLAVGFSIICNSLAIIFGIELYNEGISGIFATFLLWCSSTISVITILIMLRAYLILGVRQMMRNTKTIAIILFVAIGFIYTQIINGKSSIAISIIDTFTKLQFVFWIIPIFWIVYYIYRTINQLKNKDIDYV